MGILRSPSEYLATLASMSPNGRYPQDLRQRIGVDRQTGRLSWLRPDLEFRSGGRRRWTNVSDLMELAHLLFKLKLGAIQNKRIVASKNDVHFSSPKSSLRGDPDIGDGLHHRTDQLLDAVCRMTAVLLEHDGDGAVTKLVPSATAKAAAARRSCLGEHALHVRLAQQKLRRLVDRPAHALARDARGPSICR